MKSVEGKQETSTDTKKEKPRLIESGEGTMLDAFGPTEWGLAIACALIWGSSFLFIELGLKAFPPAVIAMARISLGAAALALFPKARQSVNREDLPRIALLGATWMGIPMILFPTAQQWVSSSVAGMIDSALPLTATAWSVLLLRRWPGRTQLFGLILGFAGIVAISWPGLQESQATALGIGLLILAVVLYGLATNIAVPLQQRYGSLPILLRSQLFALIIVVPFGLWNLPEASWSWLSALAMVPLGVLGTGLAFVLMTTLVGRVGAARGSIGTYFIPIVAITLGVVILNEHIAPLAILGTALILFGAWLTSRSEKKTIRE